MATFKELPGPARAHQGGSQKVFLLIWVKFSEPELCEHRRNIATGKGTDNTTTFAAATTITTVLHYYCPTATTPTGARVLQQCHFNLLLVLVKLTDKMDAGSMSKSRVQILQ